MSKKKLARILFNEEQQMINEDRIFTGVIGAIGLVFCCLFLWIIWHRQFYPTLYTVRHGDKVHKGCRINIRESGVVDVTDSEGNEFFYRDQWTAVKEDPNKPQANEDGNRRIYR